MKRKIGILILVAVVLIACISMHSSTRYSNKNIYYSNDYEANWLKDFSILLEHTDLSPEIDRNEIRRNVLKMQVRMGRKPERICLQYGLITDNTVTANVISKDAMEANPALKEKTSISRIPVWLITLKGLQGDDYQESFSEQGRRQLDTRILVIDAMSGRFLYSFGTSKRYD